MPAKIIDPAQFGVSFSAKQCRSFGLDPQETLDWLLKQGFRRFRLMSYWNEHEKTPGKLDFSELDWQIEKISKKKGEVSLCLGARQPRWPENHWPRWAWELAKDQRSKALLKYVKRVVNRYKADETITGWQLENEALLKNWGQHAEVDRQRLRDEFNLVLRHNPDRLLIMTTSTSWGIPIRRPIPDVVGFSYYHTLYRDGAYHRSQFYPWVHRLRKSLIKLLHNRPVFIHELQLEPWGPTAIWKMPIEEQAKSMSAEQIKINVSLARKINAPPIDLWGGEWWYWRLKKHNDPSIWQAVSDALGKTD